MSERFTFAIAATQTNNLLDLCRYLSGAVQECAAQGQMPHTDPAVQLISFQIAFCGQGDLTATGYYEQVYNYCMFKAKHASNVDFIQENTDVKAPVPQAQ